MADPSSLMLAGQGHTIEQRTDTQEISRDDSQ